MAASQDGTYYDDGGFPFDGQLATLGGKAFIFEDVNPVEGSKFVESDNVSGAPRGGRDIRTVIMASGTMQYPSGSTAADAPALFTEVPLLHRGASKTFILTEIGFPFKAGQELKSSVKLREKLTASGGGNGGS